MKKIVFALFLALLPLSLQAQVVKAVSINGSAFYGLNIVPESAGDKLWHGIIGGAGVGFDFNTLIIPSTTLSVHLSLLGQNYFLPNSEDYSPVYAAQGTSIQSNLYQQSLQTDIRLEFNDAFAVKKLYAGGALSLYLNRGGFIKDPTGEYYFYYQTHFGDGFYKHKQGEIFMEMLPYIGSYATLFFGYFFEDIKFLGWDFGVEGRFSHPISVNRFVTGFYIRLKHAV